MEKQKIKRWQDVIMFGVKIANLRNTIADRKIWYNREPRLYSRLYDGKIPEEVKSALYKNYREQTNLCKETLAEIISIAEVEYPEIPYVKGIKETLQKEYNELEELVESYKDEIRVENETRNNTQE